jgi:hypothetical protein
VIAPRRLSLQLSRFACNYALICSFYRVIIIEEIRARFIGDASLASSSGAFPISSVVSKNLHPHLRILSTSPLENGRSSPLISIPQQEKAQSSNPYTAGNCSTALYYTIIP